MRALYVPAVVALALGFHAAPARADDPVCQVHAASVPVAFGDHGPVDFGPGFMGSVGSDTLGLRYNFLLEGDYDWGMTGRLAISWPPALTVGAVGDPLGGHLTVQYGLRLQFWFRILGTEVMLPIPVAFGVDRSEIGMHTFTPWAWDGADTAVTVTAHERLLHTDSVAVLGHIVDYDIYGAYQLTTTVATHAISFPQAMSAITATSPLARVSPTANGDMALPTRWAGVLHYVGSLQPRVVLRFRDTICLPGLPVCVSGTQTLTPPSLPFASATEQQLSVDRSVRVSLPGFECPTTLDYGTIPLGLTGRQVLTLQNPGTVTTLVTPGTPGDPHFTVAADPLCIPGGTTRSLSVRFVPDVPGHFETDLLLTATDPSVPTVTVRLTADVTDPGDPLSHPDAGSDGAMVPPPFTDGGVTPVGSDAALDGGAGPVLDDSPAGCGCHAGQGTGHGPAGLAGVLATVQAMRRRRRRGVG